jgi:serine/threonine protein kinase
MPELYGLHRGTPEFDAVARELEREARLLWVLRHDNIVTLRGVTLHPQHGRVQWLVTERADGGSLESWVTARGRLTLEELLRSVMRALVYLHSRTPAVLHRDIKPANVLVFTSFGGGIVWKLGDVGIAKVLQSTLRAHTMSGCLARRCTWQRTSFSVHTTGGWTCSARASWPRSLWCGTWTSTVSSVSPRQRTACPSTEPHSSLMRVLGWTRCRHHYRRWCGAAALSRQSIAQAATQHYAL